MADGVGTADAGLEGVETVLSPAGACSAPVRETCEFSHRKCDGLGRKPCSSCVCTKQPACRLSEGSPPDILPGLLSRRRRLRARSADEVVEEGEEHEGDQDQHHEARTSFGAGPALVSSSLPLKRSRLSASPATGLLGLPENGFLHDFFGCLGFIDVVSESVVRDAMVNVMFATIPQCGALLPTPPPPIEGAEDNGVVDKNCQIERYVELAEDSLDACAGSATLELARAHITMAFLQTFLGNKAKNRQSLGCARSVLDSFPQDQVPEKLRGLEKYAGDGWVFEQPSFMDEVTLDDYWSDSAIEKLPDILGKEQVWSFLLSVNSRANTSLHAATAASVAKTYGPTPSTTVDEGEEHKRASKPLSGTLRQEMLQELTRVQKYVERSEMRDGLGALIFYGTLYMAQVMNEDDVGAIDSHWRSLDVKLRYPGLCRINYWFHPAHIHLSALASGPHRERYEELRAAYNRVRPEGSSAAPPYDEWTGISDVCDHPDVFCRALKEPGQAQKEPVRLIRPAVEEWGEEPDPFANSIANDGPE